MVEETASKSVQCGFESHRGHRIDEQPWLEISSHGFLFETHLAHVPLRGGSVPCHPSSGAIFFGSYDEPAAGAADTAFDHVVPVAALQPVRAVATPRRLFAPNGVTTTAGSDVVTSALELFCQFAIIGGGLWRCGASSPSQEVLKDQNDSATQSSACQIVGGA